MKIAVLLVLAIAVVCEGQEGDLLIYGCPSGYSLKGTYSGSTTAVVYTAAVKSTCCPDSASDFHDLGSGRIFCCPSGSGASCSGTQCDCKNGGAIRAGKQPQAKRVPSSRKDTMERELRIEKIEKALSL
ncbi:uncharacterized protein [Clytia hemisphaerica]|uniref:Cnidarian restricted protein n=1 Tax=Clytia hemisphaerica TaxID=252671 RepID=A0A7M5VA15_9CNID